MRLGIDFGTCFSSAALMIGETLTLVKDPYGLGYSLPSSVYVTPRGEILVGRAAEHQRTRDPSRYRHEFKRDLGKGREPFLLGERPLRPEDLVALVLSKLKGEADRMAQGLGQPPLKGAIITVPATYLDHRRRLMEQAAQKAEFSEVELLDEPVAAAIYYAQRSGIQDGEIILTYDLGGGTFDTALLQKRGASYEFLGLPDGLERCGGVDFDHAIYNDLAGKCSAELRDLLVSPHADTLALRTRSIVSQECNDLKHQLSEAQEAEMSTVVPGVGSLESYHLTRDAFNDLIASYIQQTLERCHRVVKNAGLRWGQVNRLLLVGGSCRIPYVQERLTQELGLPVSPAPDLELVVCEGAALYAAEKDKQESSPDRPRSDHAAPPHQDPDLVEMIEQAMGISSTDKLVSAPTGAQIFSVLETMRGKTDVYLHPDIPARKLAISRVSTQVPAEQEILALVDMTIFGSAKDAIVFTERGMYYRHMNFSGRTFHTSYEGLPNGIRVEGSDLHLGTVKLDVSGTGAPMDKIVQVLTRLRDLFRESAPGVR